jgi:hypothetical protein
LTEVVVVLFLVLFTLVMIVVLGLATWPAFDAADKPQPAASGDAGAAHVEREPTTLEGALTAQLMRGEISSRHYRSVLARLAARDDAEHPLAVPDKGDSGVA